MERRNFFKILAGAIGATVVAPRVMAEEAPESNVFVADRDLDGTTLYKNGDHMNLVRSPPSYTNNWASMYNLNISPETWKEWYKKHGKGFEIADFLSLPK